MNEYCAFKNTDGATAFLAGAVNALCGIFLARSCPQYYAVETDVFPLRHNRDNFSEMLRAGMGRYVPLTREPEKSAERLNSAEFTFSEINESPAAVIEDVFTRYAENQNNCGSNIREFFTEVEYHLEKPKRLYQVEEKSGLWTDYYTYYTGIIIEAFLVEYENYAVLIVFGSDE